jgi:hypothetical protein
MFIEIDNGNVCPFLGKGDRHCSADTTISTGDDCNLFLQIQDAASFYVPDQVASSAAEADVVLFSFEVSVAWDKVFYRGA